MGSNDRTWNLIKIPVFIALAMSVIRLAGELWGGPQLLFGTAAGGGFSLLGIAWLVPVFGIYFGLSLARDGQGPASVGKAAGFGALGLVVAVVLGQVLAAVVDTASSVFPLVLFLVISPLAAYVACKGWPDLGRVLFAYGVASRLPVVIIMFFALRGAWGTHYDAPPPGYESAGWFMDWILIGVLPQLTIWVAFTVVVGMLFGALGAALGSRRSAPATV